MRLARRAMSFVAAAILLFVAACSEQRTTEPREAGANAEVPILSFAGILVPEHTMRGLLTRVTLEAALALNDPAIRGQVHEELRSSPYREKKLHFGTFLRATENGMLQAMAAHRGSEPAAVLATLDSIIDLEFYMPVPGHRDRWSGDADLLVIGDLWDSDAIPVAFNLEGTQVQLESAYEPPETPTLAIVAVETDFSREPRTEAEVRAAPMTGAGAYMKYASNYDSHEGFGHGAPEFEVHTFVQNQFGSFVDVQCSGEQQDPPLYYNHDDDTWAGNVLLILESGVGESEVLYQLWEDDTDPCTAISGRPPKTDGATYQEILEFASRLVDVVTEDDTLKKVRAGVRALGESIDIAESLQRDDFVGFIGLQGPSDGCWTEETVT